jgi:hypothetical protein
MQLPKLHRPSYHKVNPLCPKGTVPYTICNAFKVGDYYLFRSSEVTCPVCLELLELIDLGLWSYVEAMQQYRPKFLIDKLPSNIVDLRKPSVFPVP